MENPKSVTCFDHFEYRSILEVITLASLEMAHKLSEARESDDSNDE